MATNQSQLHEWVDIPAISFQKHTGFAIDFGSSQMKIAYVTPSPSSDKLRVNLVTYSRERYDDGLQFLSEVYKDHLQPDELVNLTGSNCNVNEVQSKLNIRVQMVMEIECLAEGFLLLVKNYLLQSITHPCPDHVNEYATRIGSQYNRNTQKVQEVSNKGHYGPGKFGEVKDTELNTLNEVPQEIQESTLYERVQFPAMICVLGSCYQMIKISEDGESQYLDLFPVAGRSLLALGSLLIGANSFDELVALAQTGRSDNCDSSVSDIVQSSGDHSEMSGDYSVFILGKAATETNTGEMSCEDLAAGCVSLVAHTLGFFSHMTAVAHGARQVFFCGGLTSHQYTRDYIWKIFNYRNVSNQQNYKADAMFLKYGSFLAVIGCLVKNLQTDE